MKTILTYLTIVVSSICFGQNINWLTLEQASVASNESPNKPILLNIYTDWCGFCKKMDSDTFTNPKVIEYINSNYIPVKFNAETQDMVSFLGINYTYIKAAKVNYLSYILTNGQLSYPATLVLDNKGQVNKIIYGFKQSKDFLDNIKI